MKKIISALNDIYQKTDVESSLYSAFGELLYSAVTPAVPFALPAAEKFDENVAQENGVTYLCVHRMTGIYYVALKGDGRESRNYAVMLDAVIGSGATTFPPKKNYGCCFRASSAPCRKTCSARTFRT